ncbi:metallophosphoesterase family protein [Salinisphaera aquimarina]
MGNHEFFGKDAPILLIKARALAAERGVHLLERDELEILGQRFLGCTLWTGFDSGPLPWSHVARVAHPVMADFAEIRSDGRLISPNRMVEWYDRDVAWLEGALRPSAPAVVVTHFAPTWAVTNPQFGPGDEMTAYFHSNLEHLMGDAVPLWIYGHNHWSADTTIVTPKGTTRVVSNQLGYRDEECGFDAGLVIDL